MTTAPKPEALHWLRENGEECHRRRLIQSLEWVAEFLQPNATIWDMGGPNTFRQMLHQFYPECRVIERYEDLRFEQEIDDAAADLVLCMEVIEHLKDQDLDQDTRDRFTGSGICTALAEAFRVVKPGGRLFLSTPNLACIHSLDLLLQGCDPFMYDKHNREMVPFDVMRYVAGAGWHIAKAETKNVWNRFNMPRQRIFEIQEAIRQIGNENVERGDCLFLLAQKIASGE